MIASNASNVNISVCMGTYNGKKYLQSQIDSILLQLSDSDELIISDNFSSDGTMDLLYLYSDPRIKIFSCVEKGLVNNFENALGKAQGKYIFLSDQDDVWMAGRVMSMLEALKTADLVVSNAIVTDAGLVPLLPERKLFDFITPSESLVRNIYKNSFTGCCMAFNRKILRAALPLPAGVPMHDWWIGLIAAAIGKICFINTPTVFYRRHDCNVSTLSMASEIPKFRRILMRLFLVRSLIFRLIRQVD